MKRRRAATPDAKALCELARERAAAELVGRELDGVVVGGSLEGQLDRMRRRLASYEDGAAAGCAT